MMKKVILVFFLMAVLCLSIAYAEDAGGYTYTDIDSAAALQEWIANIPRNRKVGMRLTDNITAPAFAFPDSFQNDCNVSIDLNGKTLTLTGPYTGPAGTDAIYCGFSTQVIIRNGTLKTSTDTAALIRTKAWNLTLHDVTAGDGNRTYSDGVINAPKGDLDITGSTSIRQGQGSSLALSIGEENTERGADVVINTTGEVNGRIRVLPLSKNAFGSTLTVENIHSTVKASNPANPGGISASSSFNLVSDTINVRGGTWSAFLFDAYCADGMVSVRHGDGDYRIYTEEAAPVAAVNGSGSFVFRYASLEDCLNTAASPSKRPEITLVQDTELTAPIMLVRNRDLLLDLNGHSLQRSSGNVLVNGMRNQTLTILDRVGGGRLGSLGLEPETQTVIGYVPYEDPRVPQDFYDQFTMGQLNPGTDSPHARVYVSSKFAGPGNVRGWLWQAVEGIERVSELKREMVAGIKEGNEHVFASLEEACANVQQFDTLRLLTDQALSNTVLTFESPVFLDLGGHTLTLDSVRITSSTTDGNGLVIQNGLIQVVSGSSTIDALEGNILLYGDNLTIVGNDPLLSVRRGGTIRINGATVHSTGNSRAAMLATRQSMSCLEITGGGSVICDGGIGVEMIDTAQLRVYDGTVETRSGSKPAISYRATGNYGVESGNVVITGTEMTGVRNGAVIRGPIQMTGGQADITGGLFSDTSAAQYLAENYAMRPAQNSNMYKVVPKDQNVQFRVVLDGNNIGAKNEWGDESEYYDVKQVYYNDTVQRPSRDPAWQYHEFLGWYRYSNGKLEDEPFDFSTQIVEDTYLQARWDTLKCTITFIMQGTKEVLGIQTIDMAGYLDKSQVPVPEKEGYRFIGWYEIYYSHWFPFSLDSRHNRTVTVTACFEKIEEKPADYTVTFDSDGGTEVETQHVNANETAFEPVAPVKDNAQFENWHPLVEGLLAPEVYSFATPVQESIELKAAWNYSVSFDSNGGLPVMTQWVRSGEKATEPAEGPYRNSYVFDGWYLKNAAGEPAETPFDFNTDITESITLMAKWIPVYFVGFDMDDGDWMVTVPVASGATVAADRIPTPVKEGFRFDNWYLKDDDGIAEEAFDLASTLITQDTILIAKWIPTLTVTFVSDGGSPCPATETIEQGQTAAKPADPAKNQYIFAGWYQMIQTEEGSILADSAFDFTTPITESITLQAKWMPTLILDLPADTVSIGSEAFTGLEGAQAVRLPGTLTDFSADSFDPNLIILAPKNSAAAARARELGFRVLEE